MAVRGRASQKQGRLCEPLLFVQLAAQLAALSQTAADGLDTRFKASRCSADWGGLGADWNSAHHRGRDGGGAAARIGRAVAGDGARNDGAWRRAGGTAAAGVASGPGGWVRHLDWRGWVKRR